MLSHTPKTQLPGQLIYLSFRAAWLKTLDAIIDQAARTKASRTPGFLEHIPLFTGCAPQIQLELLFQTWMGLQQERELTPLEQCVCYCALEELGRLGVLEHHRRLKELISGPIPASQPDLLWLGSQLRTILVTLPVQFRQFEAVAELGAISDDLDGEPQGSALRQEVLETLGSWYVRDHIFGSSENLLTLRERQTLECLLKSGRLLKQGSST